MENIIIEFEDLVLLHSNITRIEDDLYKVENVYKDGYDRTIKMVYPKAKIDITFDPLTYNFVAHLNDKKDAYKE